MNQKHLIIIIISAIILISSAVFVFQGQNKKESMDNKMKLKSMFENNQQMPEKYSLNRENINPPLEITSIPKDAKTFVLIVDDPDAPRGDWVHWIVWNIPIISKIEENSIPKNAVQGLNDFNRNKYDGPSPPSGTHRYQFKLYALDISLDLSENSRKQDIENAMQGHIIEQAVLIGTYTRR